MERPDGELLLHTERLRNLLNLLALLVDDVQKLNSHFERAHAYFFERLRQSLEDDVLSTIHQTFDPLQEPDTLKDMVEHVYRHGVVPFVLHTIFRDGRPESLSGPDTDRLEAALSPLLERYHLLLLRQANEALNAAASGCR